MSTERCMANLNKSALHAMSMIDNGQITNTRRIFFCFIKKSAAQIALPVLPVPCSLKQNARRCKVRNAAVVRWCSNGLCCPGQSYCPSIGLGTPRTFKFLSTCASSNPHLTKTFPPPSSLLLGMTVVIRCGLRNVRSNALLSTISNCFSDSESAKHGVHGCTCYSLWACIKQHY